MKISFDQLCQFYSTNEIRSLLATYIVYVPHTLDYATFKRLSESIKETYKGFNVIIVSADTEYKVDLLSIIQLTEIDKATIDNMLRIINESINARGESKD